MAADGEVRVERRGPVAWVTLDRPPLNLLVPALIDRMHAAFAALAGDPAVRVMVLAGGGRGFTAGMQVEALQVLTPATAKPFAEGLHAMIRTVHEAPCVTVAMIHGPCLGAGFELAMACDLRVAAMDAVLGLPEVRVGVPSMIEAALLPALVGPGRAAEMLLAAERVGAGQALAWGLVNRAVARPDLRGATEALVGAVLAGGPAAVRVQKELIVRWRNTDLRTAIDYGVNAFALSFATGEPQEAMQAFLEKRPPRPA
jgi:enoyl-CoA hydratase/carnithine racemase